MRIAHVIDSLDPEQGGPSKVIGALGAAQAALGHEVHVLGTRFADRDEALRRFIGSIPGADRLRLHACDRPRARGPRIASTRVTDALSEIDRPHVVHLHGFWDITLLRAGAWCRRRDVAYVITPHGMLDYWTRRQHGTKKRLAMAIAFGRLLRGAASAWALNEHEREAIDSLRIAARIDVVPNGVFPEEIDDHKPADTGAFRARIEGLGDHPFALFLGRLHYKKGLDILARAWPRALRDAPDLHLVVAGPREDDSIDTFTRIIDQAGLGQSVHVVGPLYDADKVAAYRSCACFVLPSRQEGFSIAILEALAHGAPAVISTECHFPEAAREGAALEVPLEPDRVGQAVAQVAGDEQARRRMGEAGTRLVRERYLWDRVAHLSIERYEALLATETGART